MRGRLRMLACVRACVWVGVGWVPLAYVSVCGCVGGTLACAPVGTRPEVERPVESWCSRGALPPCARVMITRGCRRAAASRAVPAEPPALCYPPPQTLGEQGEVDAAQAAATEAERLKGQRTALEQAGQARANARVGRNLHQKVRGGVKRTGGGAWGQPSPSLEPPASSPAQQQQRLGPSQMESSQLQRRPPMRCLGPLSRAAGVPGQRADH